MKLLYLTASILLVQSSAFAPPAFVPSRGRLSSGPTRPLAPLAVSSSAMESDFSTAMPEKPTATTKERLTKSAMEFVADIRSNLGEGVKEPAELTRLEEAYESDDDLDIGTMSRLIFELMIEAGMQYDRDENGIMTPTNFDIKASLDVPEVQSEFKYLYTYGINLIATGLIGEEEMKEIVQECLISRTGLTPEQFDEWLGF